MARSRVIFHPEATREIEDARDWYSERSPTAEENFLAELDHAVEQVAIAPHDKRRAGYWISRTT